VCILGREKASLKCRIGDEITRGPRVTNREVFQGLSRVASYYQVIVCHWLVLARSGSFTKKDLSVRRRSLRIRKPSFSPLNYGDSEFRIVDFGLRIGNRCKEMAVMHANVAAGCGVRSVAILAGFLYTRTQRNGQVALDARPEAEL
jgi:hypothetical protein